MALDLFTSAQQTNQQENDLLKLHQITLHLLKAAVIDVIVLPGLRALCSIYIAAGRFLGWHILISLVLATSPNDHLPALLFCSAERYECLKQSSMEAVTTSFGQTPSCRALIPTR